MVGKLFMSLLVKSVMYWSFWTEAWVDYSEGENSYLKASFSMRDYLLVWVITWGTCINYSLIFFIIFTRLYAYSDFKLGYSGFSPLMSCGSYSDDSSWMF